MKVRSTAWDRIKKDLSPYDFISYTGRFSLIESGVNKRRGRGRGRSLSFFFKECCFSVRVRVRVKIDTNPKPNLNPKKSILY